MMQRWLTTALALLAAPAAADSRHGFFASSLPEQERAEAVFLETPTPEKARRWLAYLTEEPHVAGTPEQRRIAEYLREQLEGFGLEAEIVRYDVFLNYPREVSLRLVEPEELELALIEDFYARDKDSAKSGVLPGFHGYGAAGTASGQVVYANYGTRADFERLEKMGISVTGRIVLVRYGSVFRGLKVREAEQRGAAGVVIYSDPADDGYAKGDVYPDGPMRPPSAIQRGSVQFLSLQPGDPSTPGYPSTPRARRVSRDRMKTVPSIPSLPIGYGEAEKVLRRLGGARVPDEWQGGLPFAYHLGPGGAALELRVEMDEGLRSIYNVFGRIRGSEEPERQVILGNHADAWTHGAVDPSSGTSAWLETARGLAAAVKAGWTPRRSIVFASWDAEEYGLVGSTEWGEENAASLREGTVAYINLDSSVTGPDLQVSGTPSLRDLVRSSAASVAEPLEGGTVGAAWERELRTAWSTQGPIDLTDPEAPFEPHLGPLGSGSDYTVFLDHLGIPSVSFSFRGKYGVYHSMYDNFRWMDEFGDPEFVYHAVAARFYGLMAMRLAAADVVPLRFGSYARALRLHLDALHRKAIRRRRGAQGEEAPKKPAIQPDFAPVLAALQSFEEAGTGLDREVDAVVEREDATAAARISEELIQLERAFLSEEGLPGRPWFKHLLFAPGFTTGYAAWPFPELAEAVENGDAALFARGTQRVVTALRAATERLNRAAAAARRP
ncbi:MAG: M28 family metallopeptidase [Myxococcota bacterium]